MSILFGADRLVAEPGLLGNVRRAGLLTNDAARLATDVTWHTRAALAAAGVPIVRLFSPEHGLSARAADGIPVADGTDALTGLPIVSLYGEKMIPAAESLADLDCVIFDVPDVGARFYTYTWTLTHMIDACAAARLPLYVLDRPNPVGGLLDYVEGPLLEAQHASFIGRHRIPIRHSLTLGEMALLWKAERCPVADVRMIECTGWDRAMLWSETGLPFVPTSPAISHFEAALFYPGLCLFEATNLSVARGSPYSFQAVGAPWLDARTVARRLGARALPGIEVEAVRFTPATGPHANEICTGVQLHAHTPAAVRPVAAGLALLADIMTVHAHEFAWMLYPTAANPAGGGHFERLLGVSGVRERLERAPDSIDGAALQAWTAAPGWSERCQPIQRYRLSLEQPTA